MGLRAKFNLVMLITFTLGLLGIGFLGYNILLQNIRQEVLQNARILMDSALAMRDYTVSEIRPLLDKVPTTEFIPQTVPAYSAHANFKRLRKNHKDYYYKEATLNPTNLENKASDWETDIIDYFRNNPSQTEYYGTRNTATSNVPFLYLSKPIRITNEKCLVCHSTPQNAPKTLLVKYGSSNGFGWKLNSVVGAQIISVPMSFAMERADVAFHSFMLMIGGIFIVIGILMNILLHFIIIKPVTVISNVATQISTGSLNETAEIQITGNDEIASLAKSFNRMQRSLVNAVKMLDQD